MKVTLESYMPYALDLLLKTRNTRLSNPDEVQNWSDDKKAEELKKMLYTIRSSWEFVQYTFLITGVSRAFTHQLVRTRTASYAQQSQRMGESSDNIGFVMPEAFEEDERLEKSFNFITTMSKTVAKSLKANGADQQDARAVLPNATETSIFFSANLRTLSDMAKVRLCPKTQGEYQKVFRSIRDLVLFVHPWAEDFIQVECCSSGRCAFPLWGKDNCVHWRSEFDVFDLIAEQKERFWKVQMICAPQPKRG